MSGQERPRFETGALGTDFFEEGASYRQLPFEEGDSQREKAGS